jgi:hypothetical protein
MQAPRRYSVTPLHSFATVPARPLSFVAELRSVWRWVSGRQPKPNLRDRIREERLIDAIAKEMEAEPVDRELVKLEGGSRGREPG